MKQSFVVGVSLTRRLVVDKDRTISFMGEDGRVYSTPDLLRDIEHTCRDLILEHADENEDSVGIRVELDHMAATVLGQTVEISATVAELKGRQVFLDVTAKDDLEQIARCRHGRFVVDVNQTKGRLAAKSAKLKAAVQ